MSDGEDVRRICRAMRSISNAGKSEATNDELQDKSGLNKSDFEMAIGEAIRLDFLQRSESGAFKEGSRMRDVPDQPKLERLPIVTFSPASQPLWERIFLALLAVGLIAFVAFLVLNRTSFSDQVWRLVRLLASVLAAAVGGFITGMLEVRGERPGFGVRATGAFAMFVLVFWLL